MVTRPSRHQRWWWRRLKCWTGHHGWMLGPYDMDGLWVNERGVHVAPPARFVPYTCAFSSPWCRAKKRVYERE